VRVDISLTKYTANVFTFKRRGMHRAPYFISFFVYLQVLMNGSVYLFAATSEE